MTAASAAARLRTWGDREGARMALGVRRAAGCAAFALGWVGAWLLGVWLLGMSLVYRSPHAASAATSADDESPSIERVAGLDAAPQGERSPQPTTPLSRSYPLDARSRAVSGEIRCPDVELVDFAGDRIALSPPVRVTPPFRERLIELERVVEQESRLVYARPPSAIRVAASYDCRSVTRNRSRLSEHALGNAIDITAFRFDEPGGEGFEVRVDRDWKARDPARATHARFLDGLTQTLIARGVFRTLLGPAHPDHQDHFHFDMAKTNYVDL
jgi:hypothetical protein